MTRIALESPLGTLTLSYMSMEMLSLVIGVAGILASLVFALLFRKRTKASYCEWSIPTFEMVAGSVPRLSVSYEETSVPRLTASRLLVWNGGSTVLEGDDVIDKLKIVTEDQSQVLTSHLVNQSLQDNDFAVEIDDNGNERSAICTFKYLDPGHFAAFDLLHTGAPGCLRLAGAIRGTTGEARKVKPERRTTWITAWGGAFTGAVTLSVSLSFHALPISTKLGITIGLVIVGVLATWLLDVKSSPLPSGARAVAGIPDLQSFKP